MRSETLLRGRHNVRLTMAFSVSLPLGEGIGLCQEGLELHKTRQAKVGTARSTGIGACRGA